MKYLDYAWRLFGTAISFAVFGIAGLIMGVLLFPFLFVFVRDDLARQRVARSIVGRAFGAFIWMIKSLGVLSYNVLGRENLEDGRNHLIVANHPTLIDVVFLVSMFPQADCVIKEAITRNPFMRSTVAATRYVSNIAFEELLNVCVERLKMGRSLLLFPEGTRSVPGREIEFKPGAATVAVRSTARLLPIAIQCEPRFLTKEKPWYYVPESRPHFVIRIMPPLMADELVPEGADERDARRITNEALRRLICGGLRAERIRGSESISSAPSEVS